MKDQQSRSHVATAEEEADGFSALSQKPMNQSTPIAFTHTVTARLHSCDVGHQPMISGLSDLPGEVVEARTTVPLFREQVGATIVVLLEHGDVRRPIVVGVVQLEQPAAERPAMERVVSVEADGDRIVLSAEREIVLRCGEASITLTRAGKVLIRGAYVSSWSSGLSRIKGGSVQIN